MRSADGFQPTENPGLHYGRIFNYFVFGNHLNTPLGSLF